MSRTARAGAGHWRPAAGRGIGPVMPDTSSPAAGGFPIALGSLGGTGIGLFFGEPTRGFLIGLVLGIAVAVLLWWRSR